MPSSKDANGSYFAPDCHPRNGALVAMRHQGETGYFSIGFFGMVLPADYFQDRAQSPLDNAVFLWRLSTLGLNETQPLLSETTNE